MPRLLFTVESVFTIFGRGVIAEPGVKDYKNLRTGDALELRRPDGSAIRTTVQGVEYPSSIKWLGPGPSVVHAGVLLGPELAKADVPPGTEIWTCDGIDQRDA